MQYNTELFEFEKKDLKDAQELISSRRYVGNPLLKHFEYITGKFSKLLSEMEKIVRISDGQQEYLQKVQDELKKEIQERVRVEEKLKYFAAVDSLTGAYNRGTGLLLLQNQQKTLKRNESVFSICFIDFNDLKYVNDTYGHFEGDELLVLVCRHIQLTIRNCDIICRLGGDEFLVIFPACIIDEATKAMERVIANIKNDKKAATKPYDVSFSYGIIQIGSDNQKSVDELIEMADKKMYEQKQQYKNNKREKAALAVLSGDNT